jgi:dimeric dUTPase (all-alpha-NTP-PPase superfamily)
MPFGMRLAMALGRLRRHGLLPPTTSSTITLALAVEFLAKTSDSVNIFLDNCGLLELDAIFEEIVDGKRFTLTMETAAEIVNLLLEAKKLGKSINYHEILVSNNCSGPH